MSRDLAQLRSALLWLCVGLEGAGRRFVGHLSWRMLLSVALLAGGICVWVAGGPPNLVTDLLGVIAAGRERAEPRP